MPENIEFYDRQALYRLDQLTIESDRQSARQLMGRAAQAAWNALLLHWPQSRRICVLAGSGNNGGDAFALAALALQDGYPVDLIFLGDSARQSEASRYYRQRFEALGGVTQNWAGQLAEAEVIVDGLLGIGLQRELSKPHQQLIGQANASDARRLSLDIPSGLHAERGIAMPLAFRAHLTVTFIACKIGCQLADGPEYCGELLCDDLGLSSNSKRQIHPVASALSIANIQLPERPANSHKNTFGHVLVVGGAAGMSGAVRLAARAALISGAGLVSACVQDVCVDVVAAAQAELMVSDWSQLDRLLQWASVVLVGPGLGDSAQAQAVLQRLSSCRLPMIVDADALHPEVLSNISSEEMILTPHPGEAARLLGCSASAIQSNRLEALQDLLEKYRGVVVLKGSGSLVAAPGETIRLCVNGHHGMATAGMGDVLAGMLAGYRAQGLSAWQAAQTAVLVHALAAEDFSVEKDEASLVASDVIERIGRVVKIIQQGRRS